MADITEEEKYRRKANLLQRALTDAEEMDKRDTEKEASNPIKPDTMRRFVIEA